MFEVYQNIQSEFNSHDFCENSALKFNIKEDFSSEKTFNFYNSDGFDGFRRAGFGSESNRHMQISPIRPNSSKDADDSMNSGVTRDVIIAVMTGVIIAGREPSIARL